MVAHRNCKHALSFQHVTPSARMLGYDICVDSVHSTKLSATGYARPPMWASRAMSTSGGLLSALGR
jgi:hypothetical protein